jgi:glycosyltransferase involved in cell wall biosynthesis
MEIVIFPLHDWKKCQFENLMRRDTQIICALDKHPQVSKILVVDRPVSIPVIFWEAAHKRGWKVKTGISVARWKGAYLSKVLSKTYVLDFLTLDVLTSLRLKAGWWPYILSQEIVVRRAREAMSYLGITRPILWLFTPISAPLIGQLDEKLVVFDAIDNWLTHPGQNMKFYRIAAEKGYQVIKTKADIIFTVSKALREFLSGGQARVFWMPNAVNYEFFNNSDSKLPKDVQKIAQPRIGYVGVFEDRIDIDLLSQTATRLPNYSFVFVGPIKQGQIGKLKNLDNVYFLGRKAYQEMPAYIKSFDVCLVPHKVNCFTESMNPLKIYEYLACGKPVVATPVAGLELFSGLIKVAENYSSFAAKIVESLADGVELVKLRKAEARKHSWSNRVEKMLDIINKELEKKNLL